MKILSLLLSAAALVGVIGPPSAGGTPPPDAAAVGVAAGPVTTGRQAAPADHPAPYDQAVRRGVPAVGRHSAAREAGCTRARVVLAVYVRRFGGSPVVGQVRVRKDSCARYWAEVTMYDPMPANALATAYLTRYDADGNVSRWSCADGGTNVVVPGRTSCRSPKVDSAGAATFVASAQELHNGGGGYARVSWGQTSRTR